MNLSALNLASSRLNAAADEILARLVLLVDTTGQPVFQTVRRGIVLPFETVTPENVTPAARLWYDRSRYPIESADYVPWRVHAEFDLYMYVYAPNAIDGSIDVLQALSNISWAVQTWLQDSDDLASHFKHSAFWFMLMKQEVEEAYSDIYRKLGSTASHRFNELLGQNYYAARLSFMAHVQTN
jgi:hypothetical protein